MILALMLSMVVQIIARPPPENITYMHNISLNYDGHEIANLDSINQMEGVDTNMATVLKKAILDALPSYLAETHQIVTLDGEQYNVQHDAVDNHASQVHIPEMDTNSAQHTGADIHESSHGSRGASEEEFYNRSDLVHFFVKVNTIATTSAPNVTTVASDVPHSQ
ncbi:hypothetical protein RB195_003371 [Necator americanus]|uniref:Uncharacterized protein n=1 Tax=Necator americanus TaxID=51031 RepID=A0ABR1DN92_NECAM